MSSDTFILIYSSLLFVLMQIVITSIAYLLEYQVSYHQWSGDQWFQHLLLWWYCQCSAQIWLEEPWYDYTDLNWITPGGLGICCLLNIIFIIIIITDIITGQNLWVMIDSVQIKQTSILLWFLVNIVSVAADFSSRNAKWKECWLTWLVCFLTLIIVKKLSNILIVLQLTISS